jgi:hypothetical protein
MTNCFSSYSGSFGGLFEHPTLKAELKTTPKASMQDSFFLIIILFSIKRYGRFRETTIIILNIFNKFN